MTQLHTLLSEHLDYIVRFISTLRPLCTCNGAAGRHSLGPESVLQICLQQGLHQRLLLSQPRNKICTVLAACETSASLQPFLAPTYLHVIPLGPGHATSCPPSKYYHTTGYLCGNSPLCGLPRTSLSPSIAATLPYVIYSDFTHVTDQPVQHVLHHSLRIHDQNTMRDPFR